MRLIPTSSMYDDVLQPFESMLPSVAGGIIPPVDIYEKGKDLIIETPLAGVDPEKIDVSVENGVVSIRGSMERKTEVDETNYYRREVRSGYVHRTIPLPVAVLEGKAKATYENGMLKVELPKLEKAGDKKTIKVSVKKEK
jgi:HSP20 family protein